MDNHWQSVRKNQINHSSSKHTFAFSKDQRFRSSSKPLCDNFYNLPSYLGGSRSSGIGKGKKMNLVTNNKVPAPGHYHVHSDLTKNKGVKFPLGRENIKYGGINIENETPEPGRYSIASYDAGKQPKSHSLHKRLKPVEPSFKLNPGPGHYNVLSFISSSGKYPLSHINNCSVLKIKSTKEYDEEKHKKTPGPGTYNHDKEDINSSGYYFNSKFKGSRCRTFSRMSRKNLSGQKKREPGPGSYNFFSEFGCR